MPFDGTGTSPILAVLIEGRRRIEESWCQGPEGMPIHGHCAVFAISRQNVGDLTCPAIDALSQVIFGCKKAASAWLSGMTILPHEAGCA